MQLESNRFSVGKVSPLEIACFSLSSASRADLFKINCHSNQNIWRDITRKHYVINIQHAHCGLVRSSPQRLLPAMGIPMNHAKCCMSASRPQPGGDVEQPYLICKYDVVHKTGNM